MNKKGAAEEIVEQIPYILLTVIVIFAVYFLLGYYTRSTIDVSPVQANVFLYRAIYAPDTLSFTDEITGRVYPGIIDEAKFNTENLEKSIQYSYEKQVAARFEITDPVTKGSLATAYYNEAWYNRLEPLALAGLSGFSSAKYFEKELPIVYRKGNTDFSATMKVQVIIPNS